MEWEREGNSRRGIAGTEENKVVLRTKTEKREREREREKERERAQVSRYT